MLVEIADAILKYGEPVEITPVGGGTTLFVQGSVQAPTEIPLVNDLDTSGFVIYVSPRQVPSPPKKFDRVKFRGKITVLDEDAVTEFFQGAPIAHMMRVSG